MHLARTGILVWEAHGWARKLAWDAHGLGTDTRRGCIWVGHDLELRTGSQGHVAREVWPCQAIAGLCGDELERSGQEN